MDGCLFEADIEKELGNAFYRNRDFDGAHDHYKKAAALNPENMIYRNNIAAVFFEKGDYWQCIQECQSAITVGRKYGAELRHIAKALCRIANSYYKLKDLNSSLEFYQYSLREVYDDDVMRKIQELELQLHSQVKISTINPQQALKHKALGDELFLRGNFPEALNHYTEGIQNNPKDPLLFSSRADCYAKLLEFKAAAADCDSCLALDSKHVKAYIRKGSCLLALREYGKAEAAYITALELDPNSGEAMEGFKRCLRASQMGPELVKKQAMRDPEIKKILQDPLMRRILDDAQTNPQVINRSPEFAEKIEKLVECGLLAIR